MKQKKIGIPRALYFYLNQYFWEDFFSRIGFEVVLSPKTNNQIIEEGKKIAVDENCLSYKIFLGHVKYLSNKVDTIFIPRIYDYGISNKMCLKFSSLYDEIKVLFPNLKIINYNIEYTKNKREINSLIEIRKNLNTTFVKLFKSYYKSKKNEKKMLKHNFEKQDKISKNGNKKVLILSHEYIINDDYIINSILDYIKKNNIDILYSNRLNSKISQKMSKYVSDTLYWKCSKDIVGSIEYYKNYYNGIILITSFPCGIDSLVNELIIRKYNKIPILNIIIDETILEVGVETRLESFIDIIKGDVYE